MTRTLRPFTALLGAALLTLFGVWGPSPHVSAQTLATATTLSAAMTATENEMSVTSATTFAAGAKVWIGHEQMVVQSVSGTRISVRRGAAGSVSAHASGAKVTVAVETASATYFYTYDPDVMATCTRGSGTARALPWINTRTGTTWNCTVGGTWAGTNIFPLTYNSDQTFTP